MWTTQPRGRGVSTDSPGRRYAACTRPTIVRMGEWRAVAARQHGVVRRGERDLSRDRALREVRRGSLVPQGRHALVAADAPDTADRDLWLALAEIGPPMAFAGLAALWLYGLPLPAPPQRPEVLVPRHRAPRGVAGVRLQRVVARELARLRTARGLPVVSLPVAVRRAGVELAPPAYVTVVEHVLRMRLSTEEQLRRALGHGLVGAQALRDTLAVVSPESHSLWERRLAALMRTAGLPRPRRQAQVGGEPAYWVDFLFERWGVAVEVDGFAVHARPETFAYGLRRARRLRVRHGIEVVAYAPVEIRDRPREVVGEIAALLALRGAPVTPLDARRTS